MKIALVTQARFGSSRLPGKVLLEVEGKSLLALHLQNAGKAKLPTHHVVASTQEPESEHIGKVAAECGWNFYQGSTEDVLDRFYQAVTGLKPDVVVRITSDCPFVQPALIDKVIEELVRKEADYLATSENFPDGVDVEAFSFRALEEAWKHAKLPSEREHVTPYIRKYATQMELLEPECMDFKDIRMTVDEAADLACVRKLASVLGISANWTKYGDYILQHPEEFGNQTIIRNEGYLKSLEKDQA